MKKRKPENVAAFEERQTLTTGDDKVQETGDFRRKSAVYFTLVDASRQASGTSTMQDHA
jgi:hypothetical protein